MYSRCISIQLTWLVQAPIVVFDDADLMSAVNGVSFASFVASGQTCVSGTRIIVQASIYDNFMKAFVEKAQSISRRMGNREWVYRYPISMN